MTPRWRLASSPWYSLSLHSRNSVAEQTPYLGTARLRNVLAKLIKLKEGGREGGVAIHLEVTCTNKRAYMQTWQHLCVWQSNTLHPFEWCGVSGSHWAWSQTIPFLWLTDTQRSSLVLRALWSSSKITNEQFVVRLTCSNWPWEARCFVSVGSVLFGGFFITIALFLSEGKKD